MAHKTLRPLEKGGETNCQVVILEVVDARWDNHPSFAMNLGQNESRFPEPIFVLNIP